MNIIYANKPIPSECPNSIFLAGPTPRDASVISWRLAAQLRLERVGFQGSVFIPEDEENLWKHSYLDQIHWEQEARRKATIILFWIPRELVSMPAFTTNIEFGEDYDSGKVVYGRPDDAPKMKYLDELARQQGIFIHSDLFGTIDEALSRLERRL